MHVSEEDGKMSGTTLETLREQLMTAAKAGADAGLESGPAGVGAAEVLCEGRVLVQSRGKGDFKPLWLSVDRDGVLVFSGISDGDAQQPGTLMRRASAKGSAISKPKTARKGYDDAFRMDLKCDEGKGTELPGVKFIVALDPRDVEAGGKTLVDWKSSLKRVV